ncbi:Hpt domain-containing protein [Croceiramulus getboli]|nr:Hpt domain-containing protein [Flavobacteriaceae bacterium YJPT1-3]
MGKYYNIDQVREIAGGDESFVEVIVDTFLSEIPPDLQQMQTAIENDNHRMAYQFAHKMKPNLEMFGIDLQKQIRAMEKWSESNRPTSAIQSQLDEITHTLTHAIEEIKSDFNK